MVDIAGTVLRLAVMAVLYVVLVARAGFVWLRRHVLLAPRRPVPHGTIVQWTEASMARLKHLGVVLPNGSEELADVTGLAELCAWAVGAGCASVAVYQQRGTLLDRASALVVALDGLRATCFPRQCVEIRVRRSPDAGWESRVVGDDDDNGATATTRTVVWLLSQAEAGDDLVLGAVRSLARDVADGKMAVEQISADALAARLCVQMEDPQLVLYFDGPTRNGFMPWHVRITEFFDCGALCDLRFPEFAAHLARFARVEQRYGA